MGSHSQQLKWSSGVLKRGGGWFRSPHRINKVANTYSYFFSINDDILEGMILLFK